MKNDDKPFWGPIGALLADFRMRFCGFPLESRHLDIPGRGRIAILVPVGDVKGRPTNVHEGRRVAANDNVFDPAPEAA